MNKEIDQKAFTDMVNHLRKQGTSARNPITEVCHYRLDGLKCAVGALIKDEFYDPSLEEKAARHEAVMGAVEDSGYPGVSVELLREMQIVHDDSDISEWETEFKRIAQEFGLEMPPQTPGLPKGI